MKQLLMGLLLLASSQSFAGPRIVGNGGVGVNLNGHLYMLDLYERGIQENAYYGPDVKSLKWVSDDLTNLYGMTNLQRVPLAKLSFKVSELVQKRYLMGILLYESIMHLDWRLVDADLEPMDDVKTPLTGLTLEQVAVRQDNVVFIRAKLWNQLNEDNKVALLIHEAFYFAATPEEITVGDVTYFQQNASQARSITGLLFTKRFATEGLTRSNSTFKPYMRESGPSLFRASRNIFVTNAWVRLVQPYDFAGAPIDAGLVLSEHQFSLESYKSKEELAVEISKWASLACQKNLRSGSKVKSPKWNLLVEFQNPDYSPQLKKHIRQNGERQSHLVFDGLNSPVRDFESGFDWNYYKTNDQCADALKGLLNKQMNKHASFKD